LKANVSHQSRESDILNLNAIEILSIVVKQDTYLLAKPANETPPTQRHLHEGWTFGNSQAACKY
jgi:hypothetical protein